MRQLLPFFSPNCRALVIGDTGSIGSALKDLLNTLIGPSRVNGISRSRDGLDLMKPQTIPMVASKQSGSFRLIIDATGALEIAGKEPEKSISSMEYNNMARHFEVNAIGPAMLIKYFHKFLPREGKAIFVTLSARLGSTTDNTLGGWISYRASKAALNQIVKTSSIEIARKSPNVICLAMHPGTVKSKLTQKYVSNYPHVMPEQAALNIIKVLSDMKFDKSGGFFDYNGKSIPW